MLAHLYFFYLAIVSLEKRGFVFPIHFTFMCVSWFLCVIVSLLLGAISWSVIVQFPGHSHRGSDIIKFNKLIAKKFFVSFHNEFYKFKHFGIF